MNLPLRHGGIAEYFIKKKKPKDRLFVHERHERHEQIRALQPINLPLTPDIHFYSESLGFVSVFRAFRGQVPCLSRNPFVFLRVSVAD